MEWITTVVRLTSFEWRRVSRASTLAPMRITALCTLFFSIGACGDDGSGPVDAKTPTVDIDNGSCGDAIRFTGEYVDWDKDSSFCGINDALFQVQGDGAMDSTAPNGRFDLCVPDQAVTLLDITHPTGTSQCTTPPGTYNLPAIAVANRSVILAGGFWSGRAFTMGRQTFDPTKAQVLVHVEGTARALSITASHGPTQAISTTTWGLGDTGHDVYFPDVDPSGGTTTLSVAGGGAIGAGALPLVAGTMTNVSIIVN